MYTMFAFDPLKYQHFKRTENTEPHRILRNMVPLRKTQNVSSHQKIAPAFDKLRLRRYAGSGGKMKRKVVNSSIPIAIGTSFYPDCHRDYFLSSKNQPSTGSSSDDTRVRAGKIIRQVVNVAIPIAIGTSFPKKIREVAI